MPTSILDLPTELILEIIHSDNSTDAATIAYLGMTCRRLHGMCQVLVLERQLPVLRALASRGRLLIYKDSASSIAMKDEELDDVKEIFQASFHKIEYVPEPLDLIHEEIAGVHGLISNSNAVGHINIKLDSLPYMYDLGEPGRDWYKLLASLIRVASEKDMASLTIRDRERPYFTTRLRIWLPSSPVENKKSTFSLLKDRCFGHKTRWGGIGTQPNRQVGTPEREKLPNTDVYFGAPRGLTSFEISSPIPFHGACLPHTLRLLNGGYFTKLSLRSIRLSTADWYNLCQLLFMPLLSEFDVWDSNFPFRHLLPFLQRHSSITHIDLSYSAPKDSPIMLPKDFLPRLEAMSGSPHHLLFLLSSRRHLFPSLRSVALRTHYPLLAIHGGALDHIMRNLADRKMGTIHLSIEFSQSAGLTEYFSKAKSKPRSLNCVNTLEIIRCPAGCPFSSEICDGFFFWVSVKFPYVQELYLTQLVPPDPNMWTWKLDALWDSCSRLQSIIVGVETYQRPVKAVK